MAATKPKEESLVRGGAGRITLDALPRNSESMVSSDDAKPKVTAVVAEGRATKAKKGVLDRFSELFFGDDIMSVRDYVLHDILVPAVKNIVVDAISGGIEQIIYGEQRRGRNIIRDGKRSYVSYSNYSDDRDRRSSTRDRDRSARSRHDFDNIIFESRPEAEDVLSNLSDLVRDYGAASVADFYDLSGLTSDFTDNRYGWDSLAGARTERARNGYIIVLPRTILLS